MFYTSSYLMFTKSSRIISRITNKNVNSILSMHTLSNKGMDIISPLIGLTSVQVEYYNLSRTFADKELKPYASKWDKEHIFPLETFKKFADLGFSGLYVQEDIGGSQLSRLDAISIVEGLATGCVGNEVQRNRWLPGILSMDSLISFCLTEPSSGSDAASILTKAVYDANTDEYVISGGKVFISGAGVSDLYLVMCRVGEGISCIVVPKYSKGLSFGAMENKMGWNCQPTRQVIFEEVRVPADHRIGKEGEGFKIALSGLDGGRLSIGSCSLGAAQACFEIALNYTKDRKQFNKKISDFQHTQFKLADMAGKIVSSRLMLRNAAQLVDERHPTASTHCALAKKIATDQCFEVCNESLQMLGGYGYLQDYQIERYVRDCRVHQILEGTNEIMRHIVGRAIIS